MKIQLLCDNPRSWIIPYLNALGNELSVSGYEVILLDSTDKVAPGEVLFLLSCEQIFKNLHLNKHNLVIHGSALPHGKGWSPLTWQVLEGKSSIPMTLFEAVKNVDAGPIYGQVFMELDGTELVDELRDKQFAAMRRLIFDFLAKYPDVQGAQQVGEGSFYPRRTLADSCLDPEKAIADQFDLLRVCDNDRYPGYFEYRGTKYIIKIFKA